MGNNAAKLWGSKMELIVFSASCLIVIIAISYLLDNVSYETLKSVFVYLPTLAIFISVLIQQIVSKKYYTEDKGTMPRMVRSDSPKWFRIMTQLIYCCIGVLVGFFIAVAYHHSFEALRR